MSGAHARWHWAWAGSRTGARNWRRPHGCPWPRWARTVRGRRRRSCSTAPGCPAPPGRRSGTPAAGRACRATADPAPRRTCSVADPGRRSGNGDWPSSAGWPVSSGRLRWTRECSRLTVLHGEVACNTDPKGRIREEHLSEPGQDGARSGQRRPAGADGRHAGCGVCDGCPDPHGMHGHEGGGVCGAGVSGRQGGRCDGRGRWPGELGGGTCRGSGLGRRSGKTAGRGRGVRGGGGSRAPAWGRCQGKVSA